MCGVPIPAELLPVQRLPLQLDLEGSSCVKSLELVGFLQLLVHI